MTLLKGNCLETLKTLPDCSVDSIVTDPPYELGFMGKSWDNSGIAYNVELWAECLRVLKPGGHLLSFGGSRTYHRMACAIEDAGFEIRDQIMWLYGSGFPKSLDVSKAIDKAAGTEGAYGAPKSPKHAGWIKRGRMRGEEGHDGYQSPWMADPEAVDKNARKYEPATPEAVAWQGWGTALKPAHEPIVVARKPLIGTVASNVLEHGTGALNIDGCRVGTDGGCSGASAGPSNGIYGDGLNGSPAQPVEGLGRWPANVIHDGSDEVVAGFPEHKSSARKVGKVTETTFGSNTPMPDDLIGVLSYGDSGSAARFFYCAKASKSERNAGLELCTCDKLSPWENVGQQVAHQTDTEPLAPRDTEESGIQNNSDSEWNTSLSGSDTTEPCLTDCKSITLTTTNSTTTSAISNLSAQSNISGCTQGANCETECGGSHARSANNSSQSPMSIGTSAERDGLVTADAGPATSASLSQVSAKGVLFCARCDGLKGGHPTVKPLALMRYLVKLVTPPGGTVLDPFLGSGTTACAAILEGFEWTGCEMTEDYWPIIEARVEWAQNELNTEKTTPTLFKRGEKL